MAWESFGFFAHENLVILGDKDYQDRFSLVLIIIFCFAFFSRFCSMFRLRAHQNVFDYVIVHVAMDTYCHTCAYQNAA